MHSRLYKWHLALGRVAGVLMLVWALSGIAMIVEPLACKALDAPLPGIKPAPLRAEAFRVAPAGLALAGPAVGIAPRQTAGRAWYEVTYGDGKRAGFDAVTGGATDAYRSSEEGLEETRAGLAGSAWTVSGATLIEAIDDDYRKGDLPAWRIPLTGPGATVLYLSARDGSVQRVSTRTSRAFRWLGLGIHTWNLEALKRSFDGGRRVLLCALVGMPLALMAALSIWLLRSRDRRAAASNVRSEELKRAS